MNIILHIVHGLRSKKKPAKYSIMKTEWVCSIGVFKGFGRSNTGINHWRQYIFKAYRIGSSELHWDCDDEKTRYDRHDQLTNFEENFWQLWCRNTHRNNTQTLTNDHRNFFSTKFFSCVMYSDITYTLRRSRA